jgi:acetyl esterase/lipase
MLTLRATLGLCTVVFFAAAPITACAEDTGPAYKTVVLWPDGAPGALGKDEKDQPRLTIHLPEKDKATGTGVVVNPGGGYRGLAGDHEGLQVAQELNRHGIASFVLRYRLMPDYPPSTALEDAKRALRYVRHQAADYGVDEDRIGMLGFSAGGHLTSAAGTMFDKGDPEAKDPIDRESSRPDFIVPVYAVISRDLVKFEMGDWATTDTQVTAETPPAFIVQTTEDTLVTAKHSLRFYEALLDKGVPAEMHIYQFGPHGLGLAPGDPQYSQWPSQMVGWLQRNGMLTGAKRVAVSGTVTIDGKPLFWGSITLMPVDESLPPAFVQFARNGGKFSIDEKHGPCPGLHRVVVYEMANDSVPAMSGGYSIDDAKRYELPDPIEIKAGGGPIEIAVTRR